MKLSLLSLLPSISLICCLTATSHVKANTVTNQQSQQIAGQELAFKKQVLSNLGSVGRVQQAYFLENEVFATQIQQLGLDANFENSIPGYGWQIFTDKKANKVVMTVLAPQQNSSRTYINFVALTTTDTNDKITISTLCESEQNKLVIPKLPTKILKNQGIECPSGFRNLELSENENKISEQLENEKQQRVLVSIINSLQQKYYERNQVFTDDIEKLFGFPLSKVESFSELKLKLLPIKNIQNGIIVIAPFPSQKQKSYIGIVKPNKSSTIQRKSIVCEISEQETIDLENLNNLNNNDLLICPQDSLQISLIPEETTFINQEIENLTKYQAEILEIDQPQKTQVLQVADKLAKEGKYLQSLQKYYLALGVLGITEYDIFAVLSAERGFNPIVDTFFQKINPVLEAAKPSLLEQRQEINSEMYSFFDKFSAVKNSTAQKIQELAALQLGFNVLTMPNQDLKIPDNKNEAFSEVAELLQEQFNDKSPQFNNKLPNNLRSYVNKNKTAIASIRNLLLSEEIPRWGLDYKSIKEGDFNAPSPSYLSIVNLHRLLVIDILDKQQQGKTQEMLESLEASWRLSTSFQDEPSLIGQLVNIIIRRSQIRVMEKIDNLPVVWQKRLLEKDYTKAMIQALNTEAFFQLQGLDKIMPLDNDTPLSQLYRNWYGVNTYKLNQEFYAEIERKKDNLCSVDLQALEKRYFLANSSVKPSYVNELLKAHHLMLESEMLQKVLQIKAAIHHDKALPNSLSQMSSNVCLGNQWVYKSSSNGKWLIYLNQQPIWQSQIQRSPLTYTGKL
ncbi:type IV pilin-like G/H family protein [Nostoc cycadae]|uniref:Pesticin n=1 Tax=Nostoc cycadae WK-1 TaxID=1861711 RepID=A0A2H6LPR3_9NOSO|nr:type IV pilin-like G/H family protein [Nostoc cycadae]GBE95146.1 pesticin [Nostoc cycadae WK-1]